MEGTKKMAVKYPILTPRGSMCVALRRVWPWNFGVWQTARDLRVSLSCEGLPGSVTLVVENEMLPEDCETVAYGIAHIAWDLLIMAGVAERGAFDGAAAATRPSANPFGRATRVLESTSYEPSLGTSVSAAKTPQRAPEVPAGR
jgi:hypothetical protein